jgi:hypothetical protein
MEENCGGGQGLNWAVEARREIYHCFTFKKFQFRALRNR